MPIHVPYAAGLAANTNREASQDLWWDCPFQAIRRGTNPGVALFDDFVGAGAALSSNHSVWTGNDGLRWDGFGTTGVTFNAKTEVAGDEYGVLQIDTDADDEEAYLSLESTYSAAVGAISDAAGDNFKLWFEARVKWDDVADTTATSGKIVGLANEGAAATGTLGADALTEGLTSFVGFLAISSDPDGMDAVHVDSGTLSTVTQSASGLTNQTLTAGQWVKLGIKFDGKRVYWYVDGERVQKADDDGVLPAATNFPDAAALVPLLGTRQHGSGDFEMDVDWVRIAQLKEVR